MRGPPGALLRGKMQLRPYQSAALEAVREAYRQKHRAALVVMPTGTGKTLMLLTA